jgi:hypothetical protein
VSESLYRKLFLARKAAEAVDKKGQSESGDYYFARFEDVLAEASKQLEKKNILIVPQVVQEKLHFSQQGFAIAVVVMEFEVIDTKGDETLKRRWSGTGHDAPGDKAIFKAQTGCEKYFLAKLLGIPFGTDPEAEPAPPAEAPSPEAQRIADEQDRAAEAPQASPARHERPLPKSDHPPAVWERPEDRTPPALDEEREPASV